MPKLRILDFCKIDLDDVVKCVVCYRNQIINENDEIREDNLVLRRIIYEKYQERNNLY